MKGSGTIPTLVIFVVIAVTSLLIFLILPNILSVWEASCDLLSSSLKPITIPLNIKNPCTKSPVQIYVVVKPEYLPLTADHALRSLLESTDLDSGKQVEELLAYGVLNGKATFSLENKNVDLEKIIGQKMNSLLPDRDYNLIVKSGLLNFGNQNLPNLENEMSRDQYKIPQYRSSTTLTTPDLKKVQVILFIR